MSGQDDGSDWVSPGDLPPLEPFSDDGRWPERHAARKAAEAEFEQRVGAVAPRPTIRATPFRWRDPASIPVRQWLYGRHLIRGFLSSTVAPGGLGKSSLILVEALALVTGRPLLGVTPPARLRVWCWNGEDGLEELERRVAAICLHFGIQREEVEGRLFLDSGRDSEIVLATMTRGGVEIAEPVVGALTETIRGNGIDVAYIDPFISAHRVDENSNPAIEAVVAALNRVAGETNAAFDLVHHVRKGRDGETTVEDGRGAGALLAKVRSARVLNPMTKEQAERAGLADRRGHFRVDNGKANLAPPPERSEWFRLASVSLGNGPEGAHETSDHIGVVEPWQWPDAFEGVSVADLRKAQTAVALGQWRENVQAADWVGKPIAAALGVELDTAGTAKVKALLKTWLATGAFVVVSGQDAKRRPRSFVEVGTLATD